MKEPTAGRRYNIQALIVGFRVLEALIKSGSSRSLTDFAHELNMTKGTLFRYLNTLAVEGYVVQDPETKRYSIGSRLYRLKRLLPDQFPFPVQAHDEMLRLRQETQHTVVLTGHASEEGVTTLDLVIGMQDVQFMLRVGTVLDLHASAHGKVALAFGPPELLGSILGRTLRKHTAKTINDQANLLSEVDLIRRRGWATACEESYLGVNALAAPIFSAEERYEGGIGLFASVEQIPSTPPKQLARAVMGAAARLSERIGGGLSR